MQVDITSKHITLNDEMKRKILDKFDKVSRLIENDSASRLSIEVIKTTGQHHIKGRIFHTEAKLHSSMGVMQAGGDGEGVLESCDRVKDEIERQVLKVKEKTQASKRRNRNAVRSLRGKV